MQLLWRHNICLVLFSFATNNKRQKEEKISFCNLCKSTNSHCNDPFSNKSYIEKKSIKSVTFFDLDKNIRKELNFDDKRELFEYDKPLKKFKSLPSKVENNKFEDFVDEWFSEWQWMSPGQKWRDYIQKLKNKVRTCKVCQKKLLLN